MLTGGPALRVGVGSSSRPPRSPRSTGCSVHFDFGVRSPDAYRWWDDAGGGTGPDPGALLDAAAAGDIEALGPLLFNDLERPVFARHPIVAEAKERLLAAGALGAVMSGSGSSVVGLARDEVHARAVAASFPGSLVVSAPPA